MLGNVGQCKEALERRTRGEVKTIPVDPTTVRSRGCGVVDACANDQATVL